MINPRDMIFQSAKFRPRILVPRGILQKLQKVLEIFESTYHMKEGEITRSILQLSRISHDYSPR